MDKVIQISWGVCEQDALCDVNSDLFRVYIFQVSYPQNLLLTPRFFNLHSEREMKVIREPYWGHFDGPDQTILICTSDYQNPLEIVAQSLTHSVLVSSRTSMCSNELNVSDG